MAGRDCTLGIKKKKYSFSRRINFRRTCQLINCPAMKIIRDPKKIMIKAWHLVYTVLLPSNGSFFLCFTYFCISFCCVILACEWHMVASLFQKFFIRASKQEKHKFVCLRQGLCKITKESRVQCQFCRYQKCLDLQMYYPGERRVPWLAYFFAWWCKG